MAALPLSRPIALVGMPGAGKSTIGPILAARLSLPFADTDELVVGEAGRSIEELFFSEGPAAFRVREHRAIEALLSQEPAVIATGGGAMTEALTRQLLLGRTITIWLGASPETLASRLASAPPRPLLVGEGVAEKLRLMLEKRRSDYALSDLSLDTDGLSPAQAAAALTGMLSRAPAR